MIFDSIVSAKNVAHGKPEPDVYLYACEQIGERPQDCMAVEDSLMALWLHTERDFVP